MYLVVFFEKKTVTIKIISASTIRKSFNLIRIYYTKQNKKKNSNIAVFT